MLMLEDELAEVDLVDVELEVEDGVEDPLEELDERFELLDELELLDRSSRRESSPDRPRQSRDRSLPRSPPLDRRSRFAPFIAVFAIRTRASARILSLRLLVAAEFAAAQDQPTTGDRRHEKVSKLASHA